MNPELNPDDQLRVIVAEILDERLDEVFTRIRNELEKAGYADAAEHVRRTFSE